MLPVYGLYCGLLMLIYITGVLSFLSIDAFGRCRAAISVPLLVCAAVGVIAIKHRLNAARFVRNWIVAFKWKYTIDICILST